jgi:hypothetical protein
MSGGGDRLDDLLATLIRLRERCGVPLYRRAVAAARVAVGRVVLAEAERLAGIDRPRPEATVVRFPLNLASRGMRKTRPENEDRSDDS